MENWETAGLAILAKAGTKAFSYSSFSNSSSRANTTSLLVSSISPAKNTSSRIA
jgi:hypothetical protein